MLIGRELRLRAVRTGVLLTPSNVSAALKIGWAFTMAIIALLININAGFLRRDQTLCRW
jgi:uncharacterized oligopeptide transporter (OPT) family protein